MQTNATAAAHLAAQEADQTALVWILSFQVKVGRKWTLDIRPFFNYADAAACKKRVEGTYGADLRNLAIRPGFLY